MDRIKIGIMGFGSFAERRLIPGFQNCQHAELVALVKRDADAALEKAREFGIPDAYSYSDSETFFSTPGMDAVFVASSNNAHADDAINCLKAGKHVIVEKPMGMNAAECEQMIAASIQYGKELMVAQCLRYNKTVQHFKQLVEEGQLGKLVSGKCDFHSEGKKSTRAWKYDKNVAGGGAAFDLGVHVIDTMRFITGLPVSRAWCATLPQARESDEVDGFASFLLEFDGDFIATCESSFMTKRNLFLELFGENGYARAFDWNENQAKVRVESEIDGAFQRYEIQNADMYAAEIDDFCRCIKGEIENPIPGEEGLINQRLIDLVNSNGSFQA
ncbi:MAG TPA: Gfo/Idh/MocA family oxidoreductase [Candidatus Lokiarchaeia archaeon]|nr:Gfo/Idh/MocA family oxidoreductase [Candidatus Lokiarchaeia archaeon]